jgi:ubiquinone/menaquinone biosynthesis C-methylase UbiE
MADEPQAPAAPSHNRGWQRAEVAERYDQRRFRSPGGRLYDRLEKRCLARALDTAEAVAPVRHVLDLACGTGRITAFLATRGASVVGADVSASMLGQARLRLDRARARVPLVVTDGYATAFRPGAFDCVTAIRLFQHLAPEQRRLILAEMARLSRRFVIVTVMYTSAYYGLVRRARQLLGRYAPKVVVTGGEILADAAAAGLRVRASWLTQPLFNGNMVLLLERVA